MKAFLGIPTHDGRVGHFTVTAILGAGRGLALMKIDIESAFVLCINRLLCEALNARAAGVTHFCLLHSDIEIKTPQWLDKMAIVMKNTDADVLSAVVPIKNESGLTSTGIERHAPGAPIGFECRRLSLKEIADDFMPSFTRPDLLVNTGVMLVDITKPWVEKIHFEFEDSIQRRPSGEFFAATVAEDWGFSRKAKALGAQIFATTEIEVVHHGAWAWSNKPKTVNTSG